MKEKGGNMKDEVNQLKKEQGGSMNDESWLVDLWKKNKVLQGILFRLYFTGSLRRE